MSYQQNSITLTNRSNEVENKDTYEASHGICIRIAGFGRFLYLPIHQFGAHVAHGAFRGGGGGLPEGVLVVDGAESKIAKVGTSPVVDEDVVLKKNASMNQVD